MIDYIFYVLLALTAVQPGQGAFQVELYSDGQLQYRTVAQTTDEGYNLAVVDSALKLRPVAWLKSDSEGFDVMDEGAQEPRRIELFQDIPGWTEQATSGDSFSVESKGGVIQGQRVGSKLTITLESDIDTVVIQPYEG